MRNGNNLLYSYLGNILESDMGRRDSHYGNLLNNQCVFFLSICFAAQDSPVFCKIFYYSYQVSSVYLLDGGFNKTGLFM